MYGSFTHPAGLDTAADLQQFGSPALPDGALGGGLNVGSFHIPVHQESRNSMNHLPIS